MAQEEETAIICFRCGECCIRYQVRPSLIEARRIADELGLPFDQWLATYVDKHWQRPESFLLRRRNGACIFLEHGQRGNETSCLIHHVRPSACRDWTPSLYRRECREGLVKYWGLSVNQSGQVEGTREKLEEFHNFLNSLAFSKAP